MMVDVEELKEKIKKRTGREVRCVDIHPDKAGFLFLAVLETAEIYAGIIDFAEVMRKGRLVFRGELVEKTYARPYLVVRSFLNILLRIIVQECWDSERGVINTKGVDVYNDALKLLERFGVVDRIDEDFAELTMHGEEVLHNPVLDLLDKCEE
ncbi:MAG: hypothetical protein QW540_04815 [Archaeoglobaceae archaeon]